MFEIGFVLSYNKYIYVRFGKKKENDEGFIEIDHFENQILQLLFQDVSYGSAISARRETIVLQQEL